MSEKGRIARAAGAMSVATFISRVLGFARDMLMAFYFGATGLSDAFFVSFRIPNLLRELFAEGAMSSAVIPVLSGYQKDDPKEARRLVSIALGFMLVVVGAICALGMFFTPAIVTVIAPGFLSDPEKFGITVTMTRVMFPFLFFISAASVLQAALNTKRVFFIPALAPAFLNIAIIVTVIFCSSWFGQPIIAAAIGVAVGGLLQGAIQAPAFIREGYTLRPSTAFSHPGFKRILRLVMPVTIGMAVAQINVVVSNILASYLPGGSVTYLFYSMRLIQFPIGIFGVAMGMAVLPSLSEHAHEGRMDELRSDFSFALRLLFFICVPAMVGLMVLRLPIVSTLFHRGRFDLASTIATSDALLYYSIGIWAIVGVRVLASTFYSLSDTRTPVKCAVVALTVNVALSVLLMGPMKHSGLALANALSSTVNFAMLFVLLRRKIQRVDATRILRSGARVLAASMIMALVGALFLKSGVWSTAASTAPKAGLLACALTACVVSYFVACKALRCEELEFMLALIKRRYLPAKETK